MILRLLLHLVVVSILTAFALTGCIVFKKTSSDEAKPEMVRMEGGSFLMGDIFEKENTDALPVHKVTLPDFKIGKYEVSFREYSVFARETARSVPETDDRGGIHRAVTKVNWHDARAFCNFYGWRLPTEQEWEYAARSGGMKHKFAGTNDIDSLKVYARTNKNSLPFASRGGTKKPNDAGLYDMNGNVFEWIGQYYQFYPRKGEQPEWDELTENSIRIIRGGSFLEKDNISSTYWRVGTFDDARSKDLGFRCVDPLKEKGDAG